MLALVLRVALALELATYVAIAVGRFDAEPTLALLAALGALLGLRAGIAAVTWTFAWVYQSPAPRLGVFGALRMALADYAAFVFTFAVLLPFEGLWLGADRLRPTPDRPPLLLIHGYGCSRGVWWWLRRRLEAAGWVVATLNLEPIYTDIEHYVDSVARRIDEVCHATGSEQVILVAHSMGGLVARAYLRRRGAARVAKLLTLGAPHRGSELARLAIGRNGRQMEPDSSWLQALGRTPLTVPATAIYSRHDNYVMPQRNGELAGAQNISLDALGHLAMLYSPRLAAAVLAALEN